MAMQRRSYAALLIVAITIVALAPPLHVLTPSTPPALAPGQSQVEVGSGGSTNAVPEVFTANLSSPPMHVNCWNLYREDGEVIGKVAEKQVSGEGSARFDFAHFNSVWEASNWASTGYLMGEEDGYALLYTRVDTRHEVQENISGYLCIASFYVPEVAEGINANISFTFDVEYWLYADESGGGKLVIDLAHWDVDLSIIEYSPATGEWTLHLLDWVPSYDMSWNMSSIMVDWPVLIREGGFSYSLGGRRGPWWIGVRFWLESEVRGHGEGADTWGCARVNTFLRISDLKISVSYTKRAFEEAEVKYVDTANHTAIIRPNEPVDHVIRYGVAYSHTWDAFRFTIYVPDYADSLISPVYETGHEDDLITGTFNTTSPNYVERLSACVWGKGTRMAVSVKYRPSDGGKATLNVYGPDGGIAISYNWTVRGHAKGFIIEKWVECSVSVQVVDEHGDPVAGATVDVYDANGNLVASGETGGSGYVSFILPHQGRYHFHAYYEDRHGYRDSTVLPLMAADLVGPAPGLSRWGYLEAGFKRTGYPMGPPYNFVKIVLETEATLYVDAIGVMPPWPYKSAWINVDVTVYDEDGRVVAAGVTPFDASLPTGTYYVSVPENTTVGGYELRFAFWVLVDSPPTNRTATVNLFMDRHIYAVYAHGLILNISSLLAQVLKPFGEAYVAVLDPGDVTLVYTALGPVEMPKVVWTGVTPHMAILPPGEYVVVAHVDEPENYRVVGWEGVDENLGIIQVPLLNMVFAGARVNLTQDRDISCLHELESGKEPLLMVRSKFVDGSEFVGLPLTITKLAYPTGEEYRIETRTPYEEYVKPSYYALEVPADTGAGWHFVGWEGIDAPYGTNAIVDCSLGRLVWAVYVQAQGGGSSGGAGATRTVLWQLHDGPGAWTRPIHTSAVSGRKTPHARERPRAAEGLVAEARSLLGPGEWMRKRRG